MREGKVLNRQEWLNANGFAKDPFELESFRAETDPWLNSLDFSAYWDWENINSLIGDFDFPGYRFIFSAEGGGKTSVRKRIHFQYNKAQFSDSKPKALVIDYLDHSYPDNKIDVYHHVKRIIYQAEMILGTNLRQEKKLVRRFPYTALKKLIETSHEKFGYSGIFVLVDNIDYISFYKIKSLASSIRLFNLKGFIIKFFIPQKLLYLSQSELPLSKIPNYLLEWREKELLLTLQQRLIACLHSDLSANQNMQPISLLSKNELSNSLISNFVKLGAIANNPRVMWQFGHYLIEEHLASNGVDFRATDLIGYDAVARAYLKLLNDFQESKMTIRLGESYLDQNFVPQHHTKSRGKSGFRLRVFLCYEERYEKAIYDDLYFKLNSKNYEPWMAKYDILPGANREFEIRNAIQDAAVFLLCLSSKSMEEYGDFQEAIKLARKKQNRMPSNQIFIIPLRLEDCEVPGELADLYPIDWFLDDQKMKLFYTLNEVKKIQKEK